MCSCPQIANWEDIAAWLHHRRAIVEDKFHDVPEDRGFDISPRQAPSGEQVSAYIEWVRESPEEGLLTTKPVEPGSNVNWAVAAVSQHRVMQQAIPGRTKALPSTSSSCNKLSGSETHQPSDKQRRRTKWILDNVIHEQRDRTDRLGENEWEEELELAQVESMISGKNYPESGTGGDISEGAETQVTAQNRLSDKPGKPRRTSLKRGGLH